jgi:predicted amidohydrolase YtcJ
MSADSKKNIKNDLVFINGNILTLDPENSIAEAIAVSNDRISAVGSKQYIKRFITPESQIIDLEGKSMMPGFVEAHGHFPLSGMNAVGINVNSPPIGIHETISQVKETLRKKTTQTEKGKWIVGFGYDDTRMRENRLLTCKDLDEVSLDHPIYVVHISGHLGSTNSLGLKKINITRNTPNPKGGTIRKDPATGIPLGILEESANSSVRDTHLKLSTEDMISMLNWAIKDYASHGVTTVQSGNTKEDLFQGLSNASKSGLVPLRMMVWPSYEWIDKLIDGEIEAGQYQSDSFQIGAVKLVGDGSIQGFTAYLSKPYFVPYNGDREYHGYPVIDRKTMVYLVNKLHKAGFQIAIHGNGDAAIDDILYAFSAAQKKYPRHDARHIIVHCQTVRNDQLDQIKDLGITPSFFPAHIYYWGDRHQNLFLGPERAARLNPLKTAGEKGIRYTIHLDSPVVPMDPFLLVWSAVNRLSFEGDVIGQEESISVVDALRATTIDAAWQIFQENNRGSIEKGKLADLIILSNDPLTRPERIREIEVLKTYVGGKLVFDQKDTFVQPSKE